jgi:GT2 family glycosyltransferase/peptidoglycan/xylan/chitin deacetylase (PgdA/CDA1 family)
VGEPEIRTSWLAPPGAQRLEPEEPPRFSVVIRAYQAAASIDEAVASALAQTRPAHEIIVVDDGSTDDLDDALSGFRDQITVIRKENGGAASAANAGLGAASGDFLALLDADDVYGPRRLEALGDLAAARPDLDLLSTETELMLNGRAVGFFHAATPFVVGDQRTAILRNCFVGCTPAARISRLRKIGGFDEALPVASDWDCWLRLILNGGRAGFVAEPHLRYRLGPSSLTANRSAALWGRVRVLEKASGNADLRADERPALLRSLREHQARAVLAEAKARIDGGDTAPAWFLRRAATRGLPHPARLSLVLAAATPRLARAYLPQDPGALAQRLATDGEEDPRAEDSAFSGLGTVAGGAARAVLAWAHRTRVRWSAAPVGLALCYHAIADSEGDPRRDLSAAVAVRRLEAQLRHVRRCYHVVPASQLLSAASSRARGRRIPLAITFDDDLRSHLSHAAPALRRARLPATFFLAGAGLDGPFSFWWQLLQHAWNHDAVDARMLEAWGLRGPASLRQVARRIQAMSPDDRVAAQATLEAAVGPRDDILSGDEIAALSRDGFEIGFHTLRHDDLLELDDDQLRRAMRAGLAELESIAGPIVSLSYPHGRADARVAAAASDAGFRYGFVADGSAVRAGDDPHLLGRRYPGRGTVAEFALDAARSILAASR